jgi:hypothetical protein
VVFIKKENHGTFHHRKPFTALLYAQVTHFTLIFKSQNLYTIIMQGIFVMVEFVAAM